MFILHHMKRKKSIISFIINIITYIALTFSIVIISSCGVFKPHYVYLPGETVIEQRDSIVYRDSIVNIPVEIVKEVVPELDTLKMSTSLATAQAWLDTDNKLLKGKIENKKGIQYKYIEKEKIVEKEVYVDKPIPYEVEKIKYKHYFYEPILWFFTILSLAYIIIIILKRIYGKRAG